MVGQTKARSYQKLHLSHWAACLYGGIGGLRELFVPQIETTSFYPFLGCQAPDQVVDSATLVDPDGQLFSLMQAMEPWNGSTITAASPLCSQGAATHRTGMWMIWMI